MNKYIFNCPNCGAPVNNLEKCNYCGAKIILPFQIMPMHPGIEKFICQTKIPVDLVIREKNAAVEFIKTETKKEMEKALTNLLIDKIKFTVKREFDLKRNEEVFTVYGELLIADPDFNY